MPPTLTLRAEVGHVSVIIDNFTITVSDQARTTAAKITWEDRNYPNQVLFFEIQQDDSNAETVDEACADAFLAACFPLAAIHGESRVQIESQPCPMLVEGLYTAHAWWAGWGGMAAPAPKIEPNARQFSRHATGSRHAYAFLSGGVDGLHVLMCNRRLYRRDDPAYIRDALFVHGYDIGKKARHPENERFQMALQSLRPLAAETGVRLIACRTNLRHLPSKPGFWAHRHNGAALAAVAHAATVGPAFVFIGGTYQVANAVPLGSHPAVDGLFSSQRVTIVHDGSRFSRLEKVRDLASWPAALAALRVCAANLGDHPNCGRCEKCLRTRLELLAVGVEETAAFGPSLTPPELWDEAVPEPIGDRAICYEDLLAPLRARGHDVLCQTLEKKIADYRRQLNQGVRWPGVRP
jgi:hypothetical protein